MATIRFEHIENESEGRFVVFVNDQEAGYIKYEWLPNGNLKAIGTLVYDDFKSEKLGMPLYNHLMSFVKERGVKVYPTCPFVVKIMHRTPAVWKYLDDAYLSEHPELK